MKAIIRGKEVELSAFTIVVEGENIQDRSMELVQEFDHRGDCRYVETWPTILEFRHPPRCRLSVRFTDPCLELPEKT